MDPQVRIGVAALCEQAFSGQPLAPIETALKDELSRNPQNAAVMMDLSVIQQLGGNTDGALLLQDQALRITRSFQTYQEQTRRKTVLVLAAPVEMGGNTPVEFLLAHSDFNIITHYIDPHAPVVPASLPPHDIAFVAAPSDRDTDHPYLAVLETLAAQLGVPVLNDPHNIARLKRDTLQELFVGHSGIRCPKTRRFDRHVLELAASIGMEERVLRAVGSFPLVIRPVGCHAGLGLDQLACPAQLANYLDTRTEAEFFVSEYVDYRTPADNLFRKYRIIFVDGQAFACHMAISQDWKVWYLNADMQNDADKRAQEAAFMDGFDTGFALRHAESFRALHRNIGLDYFGIDCAEDQDGKLLIFEAENALIVHNMDPKDIFPYKDAHMRRIFGAFEQMLGERVSAPHSGKDEQARRTVRQVFQTPLARTAGQ